MTKVEIDFRAVIGGEMDDEDLAAMVAAKDDEPLPDFIERDFIEFMENETLEDDEVKEIEADVTLTDAPEDLS